MIGAKGMRTKYKKQIKCRDFPLLARVDPELNFPAPTTILPISVANGCGVSIFVSRLISTFCLVFQPPADWEGMSASVVFQ